AAYGPRLNAIADWETDNPRLGGAGGNNWLAGVEIQLDLFDGGAKRARLQREHAVKDRVDALHDAAVSSIRLEVRKAYLDLDAARQQLQVAHAAVEQAQESLRIGQNRYEAGLSTITDLLRVQDASVRAQTDYAQAIYRLRTSYANLELATGTLGVSSLVVKQ
ncbi:MAG: TolC family protein, partial [Terriglobales bacterium]